MVGETGKRRKRRGWKRGRHLVATPVIISPRGAVVKATCSCNSCCRLAVRGVVAAGSAVVTAVAAATTVRWPSVGLQRRRSRASIRLHILPTKVTWKRLPCSVPLFLSFRELPSPSASIVRGPFHRSALFLSLLFYFYPANFPAHSKRVRDHYQQERIKVNVRALPGYNSRREFRIKKTNCWLATLVCSKISPFILDKIRGVLRFASY